jgi:pyruvate,water dikinase
LYAPEKGRERAFASAEQFRAKAKEHASTAKDLNARLLALEDDLARSEAEVGLAAMPAALAAISLVQVVDGWLTKWLGEKPGTALPLTRGLPHNVTTEMDLKLWAAAQEIRADPSAAEALRTQPVQALVESYRQGQLPATAQRALADFLNAYGMRGVAEIDIGRPRWRDDPTSIFHTLRSYLQIQDPNQAPDVVFRRGAEQAERLAAEYNARVRRTRFGWLRARLLGGAIRRIRVLGVLREVPLFYLVKVIDIYRTALLDSGRELAAQGKLERPEDIFFVPFETLRRFALAERIDLKGMVAPNRTEYEREVGRRQIPRVLFSTGEAFYEGIADPGAQVNELVGEAVSPGVAEGRVRVILDPHGARLEPGEILVCPSTDPGWTPLFLTASGLVMEVGGMITHGSVVAREYGLPAVVGVHNATSRLKTGDRVRVDGTSGRVTVLDAEDTKTPGSETPA